MSDDARRLEVAPSAWAKIIELATVDPRLETGGILLGWRIETGIHIAKAMHVPDRTARRTRYQRRHSIAEGALANALDLLPSDSPVGYVGEWHTHPALVGPSRVDRKELRRISRKTENEVALLIAALDDERDGWAAFGLTAARRQLYPGVVELHTKSGNEEGDRQAR